MGGFICKQPNGKYCRFSTVVDCPTRINMTEQDYIDFCKERAEDEARDILKNYLRPYAEIDENYMPTNMAEEEFVAVKRKMTDPNGVYEVL